MTTPGKQRGLSVQRRGGVAKKLVINATVAGSIPASTWKTANDAQVQLLPAELMVNEPAGRRGMSDCHTGRAVKRGGRPYGAETDAATIFKLRSTGRNA